MKQLSAFIVEDELLVAEELASLLLNWGYKVVGMSDNPEESIGKILMETPDILFMDVNLNSEKDGIDIVTNVKKIYQPIVIYITAYSDQETLQRIKTSKPDAFLNKPFDEKHLEMAIEIAVNKYEEKKELIKVQQHEISPEYFFLKVKGKYHRIDFNDILYLEADGSYSKIYLKERVITLSSNLKLMNEKIVHNDLLRIHRKYVVNIKKIISFDDAYVWLDENTSLPVSESYKSSLLLSLKLI